MPKSTSPSPPPPPPAAANTEASANNLQRFAYEAPKTRSGSRLITDYTTPLKRANPSSSSSSTDAPALKKSRSTSTSTTAPTLRRPTSTPNTAAAKPQRTSSSYAAPSRYAHLPHLTDTLVPGLICVTIGLNPGITTSTSGHPYAHPSNLYWRLLHSSGCTDRLLAPSEFRDLPPLYSIGNTNIVSRPTKDQGELSKEEIAAGTPVLEEKVRQFRPEAVVLVGKGIWEGVFRWRRGRGLRKDDGFKYGWLPESQNMGAVKGEWAGARVFVACSTSGLAAGLSKSEKQAIWAELGAWVVKRRAERLAEAEKEKEKDEDATT